MNPIEPSDFDPLPEMIQAGFLNTETISGLVMLLFLLLLSAVASGSESAFFSLGPHEKDALKNDESKQAQTVLKLLDNPQELLATLLITNNFVNIGIVILMGSILEGPLSALGHSNPFLRFLVEVVGITFLILLVGEVIPKVYFTKNALKMSMLIGGPIMQIKSLPPLSWLKDFMVYGTNLIEKRARKSSVKITTDELEQAIALTKEETTSEEEQKILEGIVKFGNTEACQIMRSRMEIEALDETSTFNEVLAFIVEAGYSRIPVYRQSLDNVIGILFIKDVLPHLDEKEDYDWKQLIRKPYFIPENKKIDDLLEAFQEKKMHMAVVVDEYGGASGLVTLEDVLEEIVGDITDEFDDDEIVYTKVDDKTYLFEGRTALVDFYKVIDIDSKEFEQDKGDSETLGGFIVEHAGRILKNNEFIIFGNIKFIVESSDKRRIKMIKAVILD